ncbi:MAG TPA: NUDIX hydrolase [Gammaproteobacteria bacterium]|nr:NUDIX hydrolase [Gammaproteobacteria bacterium]
MSEVREWQEVERELVLDARIFSVERSRARSPWDGTEHDFYRIVCAEWAQVVPVTADGRVVMVRQYRHGAQRITLEIPGGLVDAGETAAETAVRECFEETGFEAQGVRFLGAVNPNPALFGNRLHAFVAENVVRAGEIQNSGSEHTSVELVPVAEVERLLVEGKIEHALVAGTLWRFLHERGKAP